MYKVGDRVLVKIKGTKMPGTIVNINDYREPCMKYAIDLDDYKVDYIFVGENELEGTNEYL